MILSRTQKIFFFCMITSVYVLAWVIQSQLLIKGDVSWQMHLARLVLHGGNYVHDFFEINPPLSIFLYMPEIVVEKIFSVSHIIGIRIYIFLLATGLLAITYPLLKKIFSPEEKSVTLYFLLILSFIYFILPLSEFAQREHLTIMFTLPYFLLAVCRAQDKKINGGFSVLVGVLAALGFCLKPFFFIPWFFVEGYLGFSKKMAALFRLENIALILCAFLYLMLAYLFFKPYFTTIIPITMHFYYQAFHVTWKTVFPAQVIMPFIFSVIFYAALFKKNAYRTLSTVLLLATTGFFITYIAQQLPWYYHFLPAFSFILLLDSVLFAAFAKKIIINNKNIFLASFVGAILFFFPALEVMQYYQRGIAQKKEVQPLIDYLHQTEAHKSIYFLSADAAYMVSVIEEAGAHHASRLQFLAWMRGNKKTFVNNSFFVNMLAEDIMRHKPSLILVDKAWCPDDPASPIPYLAILLRHPLFQSAWKPYYFLMTMQDKDKNYIFDVYKRA